MSTPASGPQVWKCPQKPDDQTRGARRRRQYIRSAREGRRGHVKRFQKMQVAKAFSKSSGDHCRTLFLKKDLHRSKEEESQNWNP